MSQETTHYPKKELCQTLSDTERKELKKYFKSTDGIPKILSALQEVHGDALTIGERGVRAVVDGERADKWGILDQFKLIAEANRERIMNSLTSE